jgi:hypothetical protein
VSRAKIKGFALKKRGSAIIFDADQTNLHWNGPTNGEIKPAKMAKVWTI